MSTRSRSRSPVVEDELRLPRTPGVVRRFWARHPVLADVVIALVCLLMTLGPAVTFRSGEAGATPTLHPASLALIPLSVVACALLLRRRQWPVIVFAASYVLATAFLFAPSAVTGPLVLVTSYSLAVYRSSRTAWTGFGIGLGSLALFALTLSTLGTVSMSVAANVVIGELVFALIGTLIGVNVGNRKRYLEALIDRSRQLLIERDQQALLAASAERARIAREMHDIVSHSLTVIVALAEGAAATPDADRARAATTQAAETARSALREMRAMLGVLRDDSDTTAPLVPMDEDAVTTSVESARAAGYPVSLRVVTAGARRPELPRTVRLATGRIVQEGLTNAMRHASGATSIDVTVTTGDDAVCVEVRNDGVGRRAVHSGGYGQSGGYGLRGLRERVDHVGGTLEAGPEGSDGWRVRALLPIPATSSSSEEGRA